MRKEEGIIKRVIDIIVTVFDALPNLHWWVLLLSSGSAAGASTMLFSNPFFLALFRVLLAIAGFAIIAIVVNSGEKKKREKKVQLTDCEIISDDSIDNPKITMIQKLANMNGGHDPYLKLSKVDLVVKANGEELDTFFCNSARDAWFGDKITASENGVFSPLNSDC